MIFERVMPTLSTLLGFCFGLALFGPVCLIAIRGGIVLLHLKSDKTLCPQAALRCETRHDMQLRAANAVAK